MFNSQKINNDPNPYRIVNIDGNTIGRVSNKVPNGYVSCRFEPREEYDNNPNPILLAFRRETETCQGRHPITECAKLALYFEEDGDFLDQPQNVKDHAKRVLEKLVNVYG